MPQLQLLSKLNRNNPAVVWCAKLHRLQGTVRFVNILSLRYDTIRDAILTCARKPTLVSLIYRTETTTKKKLSYHRGTARCVVSIEILPIATQQCRNYLYDKSWPNRWYEVGCRFSRRQCVIDNVHSAMTRPSRIHCLRCVINKPTTDDLWISHVYRWLAVAKFSKSTI